MLEFRMSSKINIFQVFNMFNIGPIGVKQRRVALTPHSFHLQQFESVSMPRTEVLDQVNSYRDDAAFNYEQWQKFNEQLKTTIQRKRFGVAPYYRELVSI